MSLKYEKSEFIDVIRTSIPKKLEYTVSFANDRSRTKFIKSVERLVRSSLEYRDYIQYLKENVGMDACAFFSNINRDNNKRVRIEVHHAPLTLYDICDTILKKYENLGMKICALDIAEEAMQLHYKNMVGLIPLSKTLHEVIHSDNSEKLIIPASAIYGNYKQFLKEYSDYISDFMYEKYEKLINDTKLINEHTYDVLKKKFTYIEVDGFMVPSRIETEEQQVKTS